jgi:hypothetical protein
MSSYALLQAREILTSRLRELLNRTADIFEKYTGDACAACIKCILIQPGDAEGWDIRTLERDTGSFRSRHHFAAVQKINDNTAYIEIVKNRKRVYLCNDLESEPNYVNRRPDWPEHLNTTLVYPIPPIPKISTAERRPTMQALLCVDNQRGSFDRESALKYAEELAWHFSIVWYLLNEVEIQLSEPTREEHNR